MSKTEKRLQKLESMLDPLNEAAGDMGVLTSILLRLEAQGGRIGALERELELMKERDKAYREILGLLKA